MRLIYGILCGLLLAGCGDQAPVWHTADGREIDLDNLDGRSLVINYWAEWCDPCRREIPELNELMHNHGERVLVLGVNADGVVGAELEQQVAAMGIAFPQLTSDIRPQFKVAFSGVLPETLLFDADGRYHRSLLGPQTVEGLLAEIEAIQPENQEVE